MQNPEQCLGFVLRPFSSFFLKMFFFSYQHMLGAHEKRPLELRDPVKVAATARCSRIERAALIFVVDLPIQLFCHFLSYLRLVKQQGVQQNQTAR